MSGAPIDKLIDDKTPEPPAPAGVSPFDPALVESMNKAIIEFTFEIKSLREAQAKAQQIKTNNAVTKYKIRDL